MVSIGNNLGINALKATAKAETADGLNNDTGKVKTLKTREQFPQEPNVQKQEYGSKEDALTAFKNGDLKVRDTFYDENGVKYIVIGIEDDREHYHYMKYDDFLKLK